MSAKAKEDFELWRGRSLDRIEKGLSEALLPLPMYTEAQRALLEAMGYTLLGGGKRLRGLIALAAAEAVGGVPESGLPAALAVEMVHAYSLIHDDLPALDDDDLRRGRPSNHVVHGEAMAILAGDALQSLAFESLSKAIPPSGPATAMAATLILSASIGARGMAGGQALDLRLEGQEVDLNTASSMEVLKTGYLISAAMAMGAALGGGSPEIVSMMIEAGLAAGLAFQIKDDLLNRQGDPALMGKRTGTDAARGKASVVAVVGEAAAAKLAAAYAKEAAAIIAPLGSAKLKRLLDLMVRRDR